MIGGKLKSLQETLERKRQGVRQPVKINAPLKLDWFELTFASDVSRATY
jgi:hypothetical protein